LRWVCSNVEECGREREIFEKSSKARGRDCSIAGLCVLGSSAAKIAAIWFGELQHVQMQVHVQVHCARMAAWL
jgi:hypothetical protein